MQTLARSVDFTLVNAARSLFKGVRQDTFQNGTLDSIAELNAALNEQVFAETCFYEAGSTTTGFIETIQSLYPLREQWLEDAKRITALTVDWEGKPRAYTPLDLEEQICAPEINTSKKTIGRITRQVTRKAADMGIDEEDKLKTIENRLAREKTNNAEMVLSMKSTSAGVLHMLHAALQANIDTDTTDVNGGHSSEGSSCRVEHKAGKPDFHLLPYSMRYKLISDVIRNAELQSEWACKNNRMSDDEFDTFDMLCSKTIKALRAVVNSPAFKAALAQTEASEAMTG